MGDRRGNALRSAVVVLGSVAFGWLTVQVAFKPYLERAQEAMAAPEHPDSGVVAGATSELSPSDAVFREEGDAWKEHK